MKLPMPAISPGMLLAAGLLSVPEGHAHHLACLHLCHVVWEGTSVLSAFLPCRLDMMHFCILMQCQQMLGSWPLPLCHGLSPHTLRSPAPGLLPAGPPAPCGPAGPNSLSTLIYLCPSPRGQEGHPSSVPPCPPLPPPGLRASPRAQPPPHRAFPFLSGVDEPPRGTSRSPGTAPGQ